MGNLRTSSRATVGSNESDTAVSPLRFRGQNRTSEVNSGKEREQPIYVSVRPALKDASSEDTLVSGDDDGLSPLSLPRSIDSAVLSKVNEGLEGRVKQCSENEPPSQLDDEKPVRSTSEND